MSTTLSKEAFLARLRDEGARRYHDHHPFHQAMHAGQLSRKQLQEWVRNRYYYQSRIPIKDALIASKSEDPAFRRMWLRRVREQDGSQPGEGGLERWLRLAEGVGLSREAVTRFEGVLPGVRFACDAYVELVRSGSLLQAVAASLTEFFAPNIMARRVEAWERHYPWIDSESLAYFRSRVTQAKLDSGEASEFVAAAATTHDLQEQAIAALVRKTEVLWALLDALQLAYPLDTRLDAAP